MLSPRKTTVGSPGGAPSARRTAAARGARAAQPTPSSEDTGSRSARRRREPTSESCGDPGLPGNRPAVDGRRSATMASWAPCLIHRTMETAHPAREAAWRRSAGASSGGPARDGARVGARPRPRRAAGEVDARKGAFSARAAILYGAFRFEESGVIEETIDRGRRALRGADHRPGPGDDHRDRVDRGPSRRALGAAPVHGPLRGLRPGVAARDHLRLRPPPRSSTAAGARRSSSGASGSRTTR